MGVHTFGGRDDKVDFSFPEEHQGTRKLVPEQVSLPLRASALFPPPCPQRINTDLDCAALAVRVLFVRVSGDDEQVFDFGQGSNILSLGLRARAGSVRRPKSVSCLRDREKEWGGGRGLPPTSRKSVRRGDGTWPTRWSRPTLSSGGVLCVSSSGVVSKQRRMRTG